MKSMLLRLSPLALACASLGAYAAQPKLDPQLARMAANGGTAEALVALSERADPLLLDPKADVLARRAAWVGMLRTTADRAQADLVDWLQARGIEHRAFWINNSVWVRADAATLSALAQRADVDHVYANPAVTQTLPRAEPVAQSALLPQPDAALAIEWGVNMIRAPLVWAAGVKGAGVVVAGQDTGYRWDHAALKAKYRGWDGTNVDHNYNWHDSVHTGGIVACPANSPAACDDHDHGTHTMGTMVGFDGGTNQIGVAPDAKWIGCRNMDSGTGTPATYTECMQWLLAPTDLAGNNPDPSKAPDIINNSWGCPPAAPPAGEGCTPTSILQTAVENLVNAGIFFVASAGNDGSSCSTITAPPAMYEASFVIGATTSSDLVWSSSSRGPVAGVPNKPDVAAPGANVRSSVKNGSYANFSGTSMAGPHVAGTAALLISANPSLRGHPDRLAQILRATTVHLTNAQTCDGVAPTTFPNPVQGYGRIDAFAAYQLATDNIFADGFED